MRHDITVHANLDRTQWRAYCSCGWSSFEQGTQGKATRDGDDHVVYMSSLLMGDES